MQALRRHAFAALSAAVTALASAAAPALAADAASAPAIAPRPPLLEPSSTGKDAKEPAVQRTVIDDSRVVIEELRVRGQLQKVVVHPKDAPSYEIIVGDNSRDLSEGRNNSRGATGKRVWNVLQF